MAGVVLLALIGFVIYLSIVKSSRSKEMRKQNPYIHPWHDRLEWMKKPEDRTFWVDRDKEKEDLTE